MATDTCRVAHSRCLCYLFFWQRLEASQKWTQGSPLLWQIQKKSTRYPLSAILATQLEFLVFAHLLGSLLRCVMIEVCFFWVIHMTLSQWPLLWISKRYLDLRMLDAKGEKKSKNIIPNGLMVMKTHGIPIRKKITIKQIPGNTSEV